MSKKNRDPISLLSRAGDFWRNVDLGLDPDDCWLWTGPKDWKGYGRFGDWRAHRASVVIDTRQQIPEGLQVCHRCDEPSCVRPDHLYLGTHEDNMRDRTERGRTAKGKKLPWARLTEQAIKEIRTDRTTTSREMAERWGVTTATINRAKCGRTWRWVDDLCACGDPGDCGEDCGTA